MDMVKGAIFSSLAHSVSGSRVLDLFAGSGALGIEALSRGAAEVLFIELDRRACECIEENLRRTRLSGSVRKSDVFDFLKQNRPLWQADIVLADPPYCRTGASEDLAMQLLSCKNLPNHLRPGGIFILEVPSGWRFPDGSAWDCVKLKKYGSTEVLFLQLRDAAPEEPALAEHSFPNATPS